MLENLKLWLLVWKKLILVPDIATIVSHVVYQPNVTTPRGDILMSGSTKDKKSHSWTLVLSWIQYTVCHACRA